ncbi:MAG: hypothetical protein ABR511_14020 [Acidimicrobiales bacterium]
MAGDETPPRPRRDPGPRDEWVRSSLARQEAIVDDLVARAGPAADPAAAADDDEEACLTWLAARRQAASFRRHLDTWTGRAFARTAHDVADHHRALEAAHDRAEDALAAFDEPTRRAAEGRLGLRVAVIGKGGAGKTVISSTLARLLARRGRQVLAADLDTNPGMAFSLGLPPTEAGLPDEAVEEHPGAAYGWQLASGLTPREVVERFAAVAPDGVRFLGLGKIGDPEKTAPKRSVAALIQLLLGFGEPGWDVIGDLEAGPTTPFERYHAFADHVVVVVGPAWRSAMTARRLLPMVGEGRATIVVGNRFRDEPDHRGLAPCIRIPDDPDVSEAERLGLPPLDACPDSPAVHAVGHLADLLLQAQEVHA